MQIVYKILTAGEWTECRAAGVYGGSTADRRDGFIHLSTGDQVRETARRHFVMPEDLVLVAFAAADLGAALRWEPSRGGDLFPHLYGDLDPRLARAVRRLDRDAAGAPIIPDDALAC